MLKSCLTLLLIGLSLSGFAETIRLSAPVAQTSDTETFGQVLDTQLPQVSLAELLAEPQAHLNQSFLLTTRIAKVCQKKGCFFIAQQGDDIIRVSFKDYGFFVPTDAANKTVTLAGQLVKKTLSEDQAAHFTQDLRDSQAASLAAGVVYEIVANGVRIPKSS